MTNGVMNWVVKNTESGYYLSEEGASRSTAAGIADTAYQEVYQLHAIHPSCAVEFDHAPFHIAVYEKQVASPVVRQGDNLDVAEHVDRLIETLFKENKMDSLERDRCYSILESLHGSTYASDWFTNTWYDIHSNSFQRSSRKNYTLVAFTRHEVTVRGDSPFDAIEQMKDKLCEEVFVSATRDNTVFMLAESES